MLDGTLHGAWDREQFLLWVEAQGPVRTEAEPSGRLLNGPMPSSLVRRVAQLLAALAPLADSYPLPHFRVKR